MAKPDASKKDEKIKEAQAKVKYKTESMPEKDAVQKGMKAAEKARAEAAK